MKCQKNRACVKQPMNALPDTRKRCTGCDGKTGKDRKAPKNAQREVAKSARHKATFNLVSMTEDQIQTVADALEFYSRIGCGQFDFIPSRLRIFGLMKRHDGGDIDWDEICTICDSMKRCVGLSANSHYGIHHPKVHESFKSSYDIYKIIMHGLMKKRDPERKHCNVHSDPPLFASRDRTRPEIVQMERPPSEKRGYSSRDRTGDS